MTCFPLQSSRLAPTSIRRSAAPVQSGPPLETAIAPPRGRQKDRQRQRQSSLSVMNAGDQACPETRPCPHPSPGDRKPVRTLAGKADGTDVLLGNVEFQHRHAAQLNTRANDIAERRVGSCRRDLLDHIIAVRQDSFRSFGSSPFARAARRVAPSLRSSRLIRDQLFAHLYISTPDVARSPPKENFRSPQSNS
jgi:hypothetical protein